MKISLPTRLFLLLALLVIAAVVATAPAQDPQDEKLESFVPSEELPADSAISFPVDI